MRYVSFVLTFFLIFQSHSQGDFLKKKVGRRYDRTMRHELEVDPISVWMNKRPSIGHRLKYTYILNFYKRVSAETNGTIFNGLDANSFGGKWEGVFPKLNRSQVIFEMGRPFYRTKPKKGTHQMARLFYRAGYHYFQHGTGRDYDYWSIDSSTQTGLRTIAGFQSHSVLLGVGYDLISRRIKKSTIRSVNHNVSLDYLFSPFYQVKLFDSQAESYFNEEAVKSPVSVNRSGVQLSYRLMCEIKWGLGFHADIEALWVPFLRNYQPNDNYFVPRGGEKITPLFVNARAGLYWKF